MLRRILKRAKLWYPLTDDIKPLKEPRTIGRALTPSQKSALLEAVALKPEWETAYFAAILVLNTTLRGCELKGIRWSDIDLLNDTLTIRRSKTEAGLRVIPVTQDAFEVLARMILPEERKRMNNSLFEEWVTSTGKWCVDVGSYGRRVASHVECVGSRGIVYVTNLRYETVMVHDELNVFTYDC